MRHSSDTQRREFAQTTHVEFLARIVHRDGWLKIQLAAQVAIIAISNGLDLGFARSAKPTPDIAVEFAFPVSLVLAFFYFEDDRLIELLSKYRGALAVTVTRTPRGYLLPWELSPQLERYADEGTLGARAAGQILAFLALPLLASAPGSTSVQAISAWAALWSIGSVIGVAVLLFRSYLLRKFTRGLDPDPILVTVLPEASRNTGARPTLLKVLGWLAMSVAVILVCFGTLRLVLGALNASL